MPFALDYIHNAICSRLYNMSFAPDCIQNVLCSRLYTECPLFQTVYRIYVLCSRQNVICSRLYTECPLLHAECLCCRLYTECPLLQAKCPLSQTAKAAITGGTNVPSIRGVEEKGGGGYICMCLSAVPQDADEERTVK